MLINNISTNFDTREMQKGYLFAGINAAKNLESDTVYKILDRLKTIEELEDEVNGFCSLDKPPVRTIKERLEQLREHYKQIRDVKDKRVITYQAKQLLKLIEVVQSSEDYRLTQSVEEVFNQ